MFSECILECGGYEVMPLLSSRVLGDIGEMLPKFQQILKTQLTCTIQSSIKTSLLEWDRATPLMKKVKFKRGKLA